MSVNNVNLLIGLISTFVITNSVYFIISSIIEIQVGNIKKYKGLRTSGLTKTWNFRFKNVKTRDWYEAYVKMSGHTRLLFIKDAIRC